MSAGVLQPGWATRLPTRSRFLPSSSRRTRRALALRSAPADVFALDFDGVLIDSEPEVTASALLAAELRWPSLFAGLDAPTHTRLTQGMRCVRPVLVRGHEAMVMLRMLREDPSAADAILLTWPQAMAGALTSWGEVEEQLVEHFERVRNEWMSQRRDSWMALQVPYAGVVDALAACPAPYYLVSSKAAKRVSALSQAVLGVDLPPDSPRLYASLLPPEEMKAHALRQISKRPVCSDSATTLHFVDDRLDTLKAVLERQELRRWRLYLADWGYNTTAERAEAAATPGVRVLSLPQFCELVRFGLVMEVDDGCEPTQDEVAAGVS